MEDYLEVTLSPTQTDTVRKNSLDRYENNRDSYYYASSPFAATSRSSSSNQTREGTSSSPDTFEASLFRLELDKLSSALLKTEKDIQSAKASITTPPWGPLETLSSRKENTAPLETKNGNSSVLGSLKGRGTLRDAARPPQTTKIESLLHSEWPALYSSPPPPVKQASVNTTTNTRRPLEVPPSHSAPPKVSKQVPSFRLQTLFEAPDCNSNRPAPPLSAEGHTVELWCNYCRLQFTIQCRRPVPAHFCPVCGKRPMS